MRCSAQATMPLAPVQSSKPEPASTPSSRSVGRGTPPRSAPQTSRIKPAISMRTKPSVNGWTPAPGRTTSLIARYVLPQTR